MATAPPQNRRVAIADAAIEILASSGAKGLTHRAVDRRLGIPEGSTSSYHRTRDALLKAAANRLLEVQIEEATAAGSVELAAASRGEVARLIAALVRSALAPGSVERHRARYVLFLEAPHDEELREILGKAREPFIRAAENLLRDGGCEEAELGAPALAAFINGLILGLIVNPAQPLVAPDQLEDHIERFLNGY